MKEYIVCKSLDYDGSLVSYFYIKYDSPRKNKMLTFASFKEIIFSKSLLEMPSNKKNK